MANFSHIHFSVSVVCLHPKMELDGKFLMVLTMADGTLKYIWKLKLCTFKKLWIFTFYISIMHVHVVT